MVKPGTQARSFTHIDDVVAALMLLRDHGTGDGYCIGTNKNYQISEVAKMFTNSIVYLEERPGERFVASINLDKMGALGWSPKVDLETYIKDFKENRNEVK